MELKGSVFTQAPEPADSWNDVYDAFYERNMCKQVDFVTNFIPIGSEDCLHLNVYTPEVSNQTIIQFDGSSRLKGF